MNGFLVGALALLVLAGLLLWGSRRAGNRHRDMFLTETIGSGTLHELHRAATAAAGPGAFRQRVDLEGTAAAGPHGPLSSELTGTPCVWHHHRVTRRFQEEAKDSEGRPRLETREEVESELRSETAFCVRDGEGTVLVETEGDVGDARKVLDVFEEARPGRDVPGRTLGYRREEWVLELGTPLYVSGEAFDRDGSLVVGEPEGKARLVVTTRSQTQMLESARSSERGLRVAAAVSGAAALVLGVVGLLR